MENKAGDKTSKVLEVRCERKAARCIREGMGFVLDHQGQLLRPLWGVLLLDAAVAGCAGLAVNAEGLWLPIVACVALLVTTLLYWAHVGSILRKVDANGCVPAAQPWQMARDLPAGLRFFVPRMSTFRQGLRFLPSTLLVFLASKVVVVAASLVGALPAIYILLFSRMAFVATMLGDTPQTPSYLPILAWLALFLAAQVSRIATLLLAFPLLLQWGKIVSHKQNR